MEPAPMKVRAKAPISSATQAFIESCMGLLLKLAGRLSFRKKRDRHAASREAGVRVPERPFPCQTEGGSALEITLGVESRHAAGAGGRDRLAVYMVRHVARGEHARPARGRPLVGDQISVGVHLELSLEEASVGDVTDGHEDPVAPDLGGLVGLEMAQ